MADICITSRRNSSDIYISVLKVFSDDKVKDLGMPWGFQEVDALRF